MKSHTRVNVILLLVAFGALILLLTAAACAPINSPYSWAYEYENEQKVEDIAEFMTANGFTLVHDFYHDHIYLNDKLSFTLQMQNQKIQNFDIKSLIPAL